MYPKRYLVFATALLVGCASNERRAHLDRIDRRLVAADPGDEHPRATLDEVVAAPHLDKRRLVRAVLANNPSLEAARSAWRAALSRYDEEDAPPDPVLSYSFAPGSIFDPNTRYGQVIALSQTIPWVGKLGSRGDVALHRAEMEAEDYEAARIELALRACRLFDRYYAVARALEINEAHHALVQRLTKSIRAQYAAGKAGLHDPIQVEVIQTHLHHERLVLETDRRVVQAQLNALLHRPPTAELPPPPAELGAMTPVAPPAAADEQALARRPELRRADAEHMSIEASLDVAKRNYAPDFTLSASYNSMWQQLSHQFMFGVSAPLPVVVDRRAGAERGARARLRANEAEQEALSDAIRAEIFEARMRLREAEHVVRLYTDRLVPLARKQARAVRPAFATGDATFYEVIAAERDLWTIERQHHEALAELHTRAAELQRALGEIPGLNEETGGGR